MKRERVTRTDGVATRERQLREYARKKRGEYRSEVRASRRQYEADVKAGLMRPLTANDQRQLERRIAGRVRKLATRGLRALVAGRWDGACSDFLDAAAILDDQCGTITSRAGYHLIEADSLDQLWDCAERHGEEPRTPPKG